jgi:hypothetical protein
MPTLQGKKRAKIVFIIKVFLSPSFHSLRTSCEAKKDLQNDCY